MKIFPITYLTIGATPACLENCIDRRLDKILVDGDLATQSCVADSPSPHDHDILLYILSVVRILEHPSLSGEILPPWKARP